MSVFSNHENTDGSAWPGEGVPVRPEPDTDEERPVCPECKQGKHGNCDGTAWSDWTDTPTYCRCSADGHEE